MSAAAIQAVSTAAAAAGLSYHKEVATRCWVLLKGAGSSMEAMTAAIAVLKQPSADVMAAGGREVLYSRSSCAIHLCCIAEWLHTG
jgi:hypothetical protein